MIAATIVNELSLTDALLLIGLVGVGVKTVMEGFGWTRSSKLLRAENHDLIERNKTLEKDRIERIEKELTLTARIESLEAKVKEPEIRDQGAVLRALDVHEERAQGRNEKTQEIAVVRHSEAMAAWERIATAIEEPKEEA